MSSLGCAALSQENGRTVALTPDGLEALVRCWRHLRNCLERAVVTSASSRLGASDLCLDGAACGVERVSAGAAVESVVEAVRAFAEASAAAPGAPRVDRDAPPPGCDERERDAWALARCGHVQAKAARMLGMSARQLRYRVRKFGIALERFWRGSSSARRRAPPSPGFTLARRQAGR